MKTRKQLLKDIKCVRRKLESAFSVKTSISNEAGDAPSAGHCAAVAAILFQRNGGKLVSTMVGNESHWFNRFPVNDGWVDVDLTADQFGGPSIVVKKCGCLYPGARERRPDELNSDTVRRARVLAGRAKIEFDESIWTRDEKGCSG